MGINNNRSCPHLAEDHRQVQSAYSFLIPLFLGFELCRITSSILVYFLCEKSWSKPES
jgi:hypothetical protein